MNIKKQARIRRARKSQAKTKRLGYETGIARLVIGRTPRHVYAQVIAPSGGKILAHATSLELRNEKSTESGKIAIAKEIGKRVAERALKAGVKRVACDRSGFKYHGRIAALVDAARETGVAV